MKRLLAVFFLLTSLGLAQQRVAPVISLHEYLLQHALPAVWSLYRQTPDGGMTMACSTWAFENKPTSKDKDKGKDNLVHFASDSHCVERLEDDKNKAASNFYFVSQDEENPSFLKVRLLFFGDILAGNDFSVFEARTQSPVPVLAIGVDPSEPDTPVTEVGNAEALGRGIIHGSVMRPHFDRIFGPPGGNWYGNIQMQLSGSGPGASGAPIICDDQRAVCGLVAGAAGDTREVNFAYPISRFKTWYASAQDPSDLRNLVEHLRQELDTAQGRPLVTPPPKNMKPQKLHKNKKSK